MSGRTRPCEICGQLIDPERVEALPKTRLCSDHAQAIKAYGGEFIRTGTQSSLGKDGSLKKNYGDVSIEERRNAEALRKLRQDYEHHRRDSGVDRGG
jgi:hypothetical protein